MTGIPTMRTAWRQVINGETMTVLQAANAEPVGSTVLGVVQLPAGIGTGKAP